MSYNGWTNYETWNVMLWINNDEGLYSIARESKNYLVFKEALREIGGDIAIETPDHVAWNDSGLDMEEINSAFRELCGDEDEDEDE